MHVRGVLVCHHSVSVYSVGMVAWKVTLLYDVL